MRTLLLIVSLTVICCGSLNAQVISIPTGKTLIQSETPFGESSTIKLEYVRNADGNEVPIKTEQGKINNVAYRFYYHDGSGMFAGKRELSLNDIEHLSSHWRVGCSKDAMSDRGSCYMSLRDLLIFVNADGKATLSIGSDHYPGSSVMLRIDNGAPVAMSTRLLKGSFNFQDSQKLIAQISRAKTLTTRYRKWPDGYDRDDVWEEVYGFNEALQYIRWAVARIK
ncbi:MAG TPA: hypothetical protein DHU55_18770 [Blastocatellia bacterium]|nr:hypothetical protein [Blastocatellia bacterium]